MSTGVPPETGGFMSRAREFADRVRVAEMAFDRALNSGVDAPPVLISGQPVTTVPPEIGRGFHLTTADHYRLKLAVRPLVDALGFGSVYLVGSVNDRADFRDVDVRAILADADFDRRFGSDPKLWSVFCFAVSRWLSVDTGLPIDFQVQRQTEANEKHHGVRNALGIREYTFAGGGDATRFTKEPTDA